MTQRERVHCGGRGRRHGKKIRPFLQGGLDGLCGVYSIVNAVRVLCPELDNEVFEILFDHLMQSMKKAGAEPSLTITGGIGQRVLAALLKEALTDVDAEYDINLTCRRLPKKLRRTTSLGGLYRRLEATLSPTCVAVLGMGGRHCHWTIAVSATQHRIRLFDSTRMSVLRRRDCTVGKAVKRTGISLPHVFLIERGE